MNLVQALQKSLDDLKAITKIDFGLFEVSRLFQQNDELHCEVATDDFTEITIDVLQGFAASMAESQEFAKHHFFKVKVKNASEYILVVRGMKEAIYPIGKICVSQLENLMLAYAEHEDEGSFIQNLLLDNVPTIEVYNTAKKLRMETECRRGVFVIETQDDEDDAAYEIVKGLFGDRGYVLMVDERHVIFVQELNIDESLDKLTTKNRKNAGSAAKEMEQTARMLLDMLNAEAMLKVRIGYGSVVGELKELSRSYKEAKMALDVGKIFYGGQTIIAYELLGIGRLIYQLPTHLCEIFLGEVFPNGLPEEVDTEVLRTIQIFFDNSLNISETARQLFIHRNTLVYRLEKIQKVTGLDVRSFDDALTFYIALMVANYMEYRRKEHKK